MVLHSSISSTERRINVAICGSGIAGSVAANILSKDSRLAVTVFEAGRGPGGRSSTRRAGDFVFDHGAQYISCPKDSNFLPIFSDWRNKNIISQWDGIFATVQISSTDIKYSDPNSFKYVGYPYMNSICKYLLSSDNTNTDNNGVPISCVFGQRIRAEPIVSGSDELSGWKVICATTNKILGDFDVLISGDRGFQVLSGGDSGNLLARSAYLRALKDEYIDSIQAMVSSSPILATMIVLRQSLPRDVFPFDGVTFLPADGSVLGWISRDSSKPGRARVDGKECWVVQSNSDYAAAVIHAVKADPAFSGRTSEEIKQEVNSRANAALTQAFCDYILLYNNNNNNNNNNNKQQNQKQQDSGTKLDSSESEVVVDVELSIGHRWSAAFPSITKLADNNNNNKEEEQPNKKCYVNWNARFIACGDYFDSSSSGRIESAAVSGLEAAQNLIQVVDQLNCKNNSTDK